LKIIKNFRKIARIKYIFLCHERTKKTYWGPCLGCRSTKPLAVLELKINFSTYLTWLEVPNGSIRDHAMPTARPKSNLCLPLVRATDLRPTVLVSGRTPASTAAQHFIPPFLRHAQRPNSCSKQMWLVSHIATYTTHNLLLKYSDKTFTTCVWRKMKHLKYLSETLAKKT
jgi:hypothetical protein